MTIARALLADPKILILDECDILSGYPSGTLDSKAMKNLMKGRTSFVIAHRLSTIQEADKILVLKEGQIIEQGNHESLLEAKGFYYDLYMSQFFQESRSSIKSVKKEQSLLFVRQNTSFCSCCFLCCSSATKVILSQLFLIVNVFYIFHAIQNILKNLASAFPDPNRFCKLACNKLVGVGNIGRMPLTERTSVLSVVADA